MKIARIELTAKCGHLNGDWWEWLCVATLPDGSRVNGSVQADGLGELIAFETFEPDEL